MNQLTIAVLGPAVLLGAALLWMVVADRRRQHVQQRMKMVVSTARSEVVPVAVPSLRRRLSRAGPGALYSLHNLPGALYPALAAAGNRIGLPHLVVIAFVAFVVVSGLAYRLLALNPVVDILLGAAAGLAAAMLLLHVAQVRYRTRFLDVFPDTLDMICRAVRAGLPVAEAMSVAARETAAPVAGELQRTLDEVKIGVELQEALQTTADRVRVPDFRFYVVALAMQKRTGGGLAETLGNLSAVIRARKALRLKARALAAETKASAFVLALLPFFVGGMMYLINRDLMSILFTDSRGRLMLGLAVFSLMTGVGVMSMIIKRALR
jgi:tight adherence protein B